ncbi:MAG: hypothetical protein ACREJX_16020, partial [Polyangiaceae bacterium]
MDRRVTIEAVADLRASANVPYDVAQPLPNGAFGVFGPGVSLGTPEYAAADARAISPVLQPPSEPIAGWRVRGSLWPGEHFIARIPQQWNGRLVVGGTPALRSEYANDLIWSDPLVARGYAYVCGNKSQGDGIVLLTGDARFEVGGVTLPRYLLSDGTGVSFWQHAPGSTFRCWMRDFFSITDVAKESIVQVHGTEPEVVYAVGLSNGGGQVRFAMEMSNAYDGALVWNSVLWTKEHNLLAHLPQAVELMERGEKDGIESLGFPPDIVGRDGSSIYEKNNRIYWRITAWLHAMVFDPEASMTYEDVRDPAPAESWNSRIGSWRLARSPQISARIGEYAHSGNIRGKMIDLASQYDHFITPQMHWEPYGKLVAAAGKGA